MGTKWKVWEGVLVRGEEINRQRKPRKRSGQQASCCSCQGSENWVSQHDENSLRRVMGLGAWWEWSRMQQKERREAFSLWREAEKWCTNWRSQAIEGGLWSTRRKYWRFLDRVWRQSSQVDCGSLSQELHREVEIGDIGFGMFNLHMTGTSVRMN